MSKQTDDVNSFLVDDAIRKELINSAGENAIDILKLLKNETEDEKIAEKLKLKVSDVRSVLNKLNALGITFYNRTKNEDTGWFYYNWSIDKGKFREWIITTIKNQDARIKYAHLINESGQHLLSVVNVREPCGTVFDGLHIRNSMAVFCGYLIVAIWKKRGLSHCF